MAVLAARLDEAVTDIELEPGDIARVVGASPRTVSRWIGGETSPRRAARERVLELIAVTERLRGVLEPEAARDWLLSPNAWLDNEKPIDLLASGEYRRVLAAVDALGEGVFV